MLFCHLVISDPDISQLSAAGQPRSHWSHVSCDQPGEGHWCKMTSNYSSPVHGIRSGWCDFNKDRVLTWPKMTLKIFHEAKLFKLLITRWSGLVRLMTCWRGCGRLLVVAPGWESLCCPPWGSTTRVCPRPGQRLSSPTGNWVRRSSGGLEGGDYYSLHLHDL